MSGQRSSAAKEKTRLDLPTVSGGEVVEFRHPDGSPVDNLCVGLMNSLLKDGILVLPDSPEGHVLAFIPPLGLSAKEIGFTLNRLRHHLRTAD